MKRLKKIKKVSIMVQKNHLLRKISNNKKTLKDKITSNRLKKFKSIKRKKEVNLLYKCFFKRPTKIKNC